MESENFASSDNKFVSGDNVTFDDTAVKTDVEINEDLAPGNIVFNNNSKVYTLSGNGAIEGNGSVTLKGKSAVNIKNTNRYTGGTYIDGGYLRPATLANKDGLEYGSLGAADNTITMSNQGKLWVNIAMTSSHPIVLGENGGQIETANGANLIVNGGISKANKGTNRDLYKVGNGTLQLNCAADFDKLYINAGKVYDFQDGHFNGKTIVLNGSSSVE